MATLTQLLDEGEHLHQDFKFKIDDQRKIARTLCAFANTDGGRLLIGVNDNRKVVGCHPEKELHMIDCAAKLFCQPPVKYSSKVWQVEFKLVLEINIDRSVEIPHKAKEDSGKWKPYIRIEDHTMAVNKIMEGVWNEKKKSTVKPEKFDAEEIALLNLIKMEQPITLSKMYRSSNLPLRKVDRLLVLLICWDLVEMHFESDGTYYKIKENR